MRRLCIAFVTAGLFAAGAQAATINILAFGQSNMAGRFGPAPNYSGPDPNIRVWNWQTKKLEPAQLGVFPFWTDRNGNGPANNLAYVFGQNLVKTCKVEVNLTYLATDGAKLEYFLPNDVLKKNSWSNGQTKMYFGPSLADELLSSNSQTRSALIAAGATTYDIVLIHQGEANSLRDGDTAAVYEKKLKAMINELVTRRFVRRDTKFVLGTINPLYPKADEHKKAVLSLQAPTVAIASWDGIETFDTPKVVGDRHATGNGLQTLGERYFEKYLYLEGGRCPASK